jgi:hypothetical protein
LTAGHPQQARALHWKAALVSASDHDESLFG